MFPHRRPRRHNARGVVDRRVHQHVEQQTSLGGHQSHATATDSGITAKR